MRILFLNVLSFYLFVLFGAEASDISEASPIEYAGRCEIQCFTARESSPVRLETPAAINGRIVQGLTYVAETSEWYYLLGAGEDWKSRSNTVVRSDRYGALLDYSADELLTLGHGQDLKHLYWKGSLTFLSQNKEGNGMTTFEYSKKSYGGLLNIRTFSLTPAGKNRHTTIGLSKDKRFVVAAYTHPVDGKTYTRVFDAAKLLSGAEGYRSDEALGEICLSDSSHYEGSPGAGQHLQAVTMDDDYIYVLNGFWKIDVPKYIYAFRRADGHMVAKTQVVAGMVIAAHAGAGRTYEPEGLEWVSPLEGQPILYMGMRTGGGAGNVNWAVPLGSISAIFPTGVWRDRSRK